MENQEKELEEGKNEERRKAEKRNKKGLQETIIKSKWLWKKLLFNVYS